MKKNESRTPPKIIHKNKLRMDLRLNCKARNLEENTDTTVLDINQ